MKTIPSILAVIAAFCIAWCAAMPEARSEESYADVVIHSMANWDMTQMQTFSGSVPSRAWVFTKEDAEVFVSVMVTEGVRQALEGQSRAALAKLYLENFVGGWGGRLHGELDGISMAAFCGGEAGYKGEATFGDSKYEYYGCLRMNKERSRTVSVVTWVAPGTPESVAASRLITYIEATQFKK